MLLPNRVELKIISQSLQSKNPALGVALLNEYSMPHGLRNALLNKLSKSDLHLIPAELLGGVTMAEASKETQRAIRVLPSISTGKSRSVPTRFSISQSAKVRLEKRRKIANTR